ncbi:MAG: hypothetical protein HC817_00015 [Saprospiraceae bacterium]|nr:hypothetical protein [Saprospiraceae bacterium]
MAKKISTDIKPYLFFFAQLLIGVLPLTIGFYKKYSINDTYKPFKRVVLHVFGFAGILLTLSFFKEQYSGLPIDIKISDIIPQVQKFTSRFIKGEFPYAVFSDFGWDMQPTYLPAQWLPFLPAQVWHFDPRWTCFGVFAL